MAPAGARGVTADVETGRLQVDSAPLSDLPLRGLKRCCPAVVGILEGMGYDRALIIQDVSHLSLYVCCLFSLGCFALWFADVYTGSCMQPAPWLGKVSRGEAVMQCALEVFGAVIFFGTLRDSIEMLANYDDRHHELVEKKKKLMSDLHTEVMHAIDQAMKNAQELLDAILRLHEKTIDEHVHNYFRNTLATLYKGLIIRSGGDASRLPHGASEPCLPHPASSRPHAIQHSSTALSESTSTSSSFLSAGVGTMSTQQQDDQKMLEDFTDLVGNTLKEPTHLAAGFCRKIRPVVEGMDNGKDFAGAVYREDIDPRFWTVWLEHSVLGQSHRVHYRADEKPEELKAPGKFVLEPLVTFLQKLKNNDAIRGLVRDGSEGAERADRRLFGAGKPPWPPDESGCCVSCVCPRMIGYVFRYFCCICRCLCGLCACDRAFDYPKRIRIGCVWFEIVSKLHERLIHGLLLSMVFFLAFGCRAAMITQHGCPDEDDGQFSACVWDMARRSLVEVGLLFQVPSLALALSNIQNLDAIIKIREDIRRLESLRAHIEEFDQAMRVNSEQQKLIRAVEERVIARITLVNDFRRHIVRPDVKDNSDLLRESTEETQGTLAAVADALGPALEWMELPCAVQEERARGARELAERLRSRGFRRAGSRSASLLEPSRSAHSPRLPQQSYASLGPGASPRGERPVSPSPRAVAKVAKRRELTPPLQPRAPTASSPGR